MLTKKAAAVVLLGIITVGCAVPSPAQTRGMAETSDARKARKKQAKAQKKYVKAQKKAEKKMLKTEKKNTHYPSHSF